MPQTTYTLYPKEGYNGGLYDLQEKDIISYVDPNEIVHYGSFLAKGALFNECAVPTQATDITTNGVGVAIFTHKQPDNFTQAYYAINQTVNTLKKGRVYVTVEEAVSVGDPVYVRFAAGSGGTQKGAFRRSDDSASAALVPATNAKWYKGAPSGNVAVLEVFFIGN